MLAFRQRLAPLLLVLYVAAVHGLPAAHLLWHRSDHVHVFGGLRWLHPLLPPHVHGAAHLHTHTDASVAPVQIGKGAQLREGNDEATSLNGFGLHVAAGPAHALFALLVPTAHVSVHPATVSHSLVDPLIVRSGFDCRADPRARAPPASI